jgi:hypothetical protein
MYDVVVYGATPAGIMSAIAAAGAGCDAAVVTADPQIGGMQTSGLGFTNMGHREPGGGLVRVFHDRIRAYYAATYGHDSAQVRDCSDGFFFEPHVAKKVFQDWLAEAGVDVVTKEQVVGAETAGSRLTGLTTESGDLLAGRVFIDASYEGDLLAWAGCSYRVGRESREEYGETLAGVRFPPEQEGQADGKTQGYDYRLCLTNVAENRVPFREPPTYDPARYAILRARLREGTGPSQLREFISLNPMPNGKTDSRVGEWTGGSWDYPEAEPAVRRYIAQKHREYSEGYLWFLLTDEAVPQAVREELATYGYARDEFVDNDNWPYLMYVREARRVVGDFVMTEHDVTANRVKPDSVALGSFFLDVHPVRYVAKADAPGGVVEEGELGPHVDPYEIPYRALLPRRAELTNLLVPVCLSASHVAISSIRMEPVYGMLGHAAGVAAALSVTAGVDVDEVPIAALLKQLETQGQLIRAAQIEGRQ